MIFCFKQKTAYEMRISDWSSDVCSSDLARPAIRPQYLEIVEGPGQLALQAEVVFDQQEFGRFPLSHPVQSPQIQASRNTGSVTRMVVPAPTLLIASRSPPNSRA